MLVLAPRSHIGALDMVILTSDSHLNSLLTLLFLIDQLGIFLAFFAASAIPIAAAYVYLQEHFNRNPFNSKFTPEITQTMTSTREQEMQSGQVANPIQNNKDNL